MFGGAGRRRGMTAAPFKKPGHRVTTKTINAQNINYFTHKHLETSLAAVSKPVRPGRAMAHEGNNQFIMPERV